MIWTVIAALAAWGHPDLDRREIQCLAQNIYHEARGEPTVGQIAVAQVTLRRAELRSQSICEAVLAPGQFTWTAGPARAESDEPGAWTASVHIAILTRLSLVEDQSGGATHYYEWRRVRPQWAKEMTEAITLGAHRFMRAKPKPKLKELQHAKL